MTRLQRATLYNRTLSTIKRAAVPTMVDMVEVTLRVKAPISPDLRRLLESARFTYGAWGALDDGYLTFTHPVKTCYPADFPGFAREVVAAMQLAQREGRRIEVVRYK